jgi:hypothetical protein
VLRYLPVLVILALLAIALAAPLRRDRRAVLPESRRGLTPTPHWRAAHWSKRGRTHVGVQRALQLPNGREDVIERREMTSIPDDAPDYELRFSDAMAAARVRAEVLNAEGEV